jgi:hypothetical protein
VKKYSDRRKTENWQQILEKKKKSEELKMKILEMETKLNKLYVELNNVNVIKNPWSKYNSEYDSLKREIYFETSSCNREKDALAFEEKGPPALFLPLPKDRRKAFQVIFYLFMPNELQTLFRLSNMAQQLLMPKDYDSLRSKLGTGKAELMTLV